ncbi:MAG: zinc transporter ZupT [Duncaniella sp.]|nr:zinc transporter ZupT [Duncaniella sp.]
MEDISTHSLIVALMLTLVAGMGTGIGALLSLLPQARETRFLAGALGFSAGVMLYVSFLDLMPQALADLGEIYESRVADVYCVLAFFGGIALIALIDFLVPEEDNPHEYNHVEHPVAPASRSGRTGIMLALVIGIHNFPEGMATFISALDGVTVAIPIVVAITLHNIPEGIAVSVPVYNATGSRRKALVWSIISGLAEPLGAVVGMFFLLPLWTPVMNAVLLAGVAGVMVYISLDELLPGAESYGHHHITVTFLILGMALMATSMLMA